MNADILKPIQAEIARALTLLRVDPQQVTELRVLEAITTDCLRPHTRIGFFTSTDALIKAVLGIRSAKGMYITLQRPTDSLIARRCNRVDKAEKSDGTKDTEIIARPWLPIDIDAVRPAGISSTEEEHEAALTRAREVRDYLSGQGWPLPIFADSGNGAHLLYRVDLPVDDGGLVNRILKSLDARFSDDRLKVDTSVGNPARIWKLYGTPVRKGDSTPTRPHRMARILEVPNAD